MDNEGYEMENCPPADILLFTRKVVFIVLVHTAILSNFEYTLFFELYIRTS